MLEDSAPPRLRLLVPVLIIAIAMIALYTAGVTDLLIAAIFAAGIMMVRGWHFSRTNRTPGSECDPSTAYGQKHYCGPRTQSDTRE